MPSSANAAHHWMEALGAGAPSNNGPEPAHCEPAAPARDRTPIFVLLRVARNRRWMLLIVLLMVETRVN
jgi:hypothetical protein